VVKVPTNETFPGGGFREQDVDLSRDEQAGRFSSGILALDFVRNEHTYLPLQ